MKYCSLILFCLLAANVVAQKEIANNKRLQKALRVDHAPTIDGVLDENLWNTPAEGANFVQYQPVNGKPSSFQTTVQIIYTDRAMFVAARCYDSEPKKILHEFGGRDDLGRNADAFGILLDPYNSGISAFTFFVTAAGVQGDFYLTGTFWDSNWDAVWKSAVKIDDWGWTAEIEIPYYAIRFPRQDVQEWGINFFRSVKRNQEESYWNHIDNSVQGIVNQSGLLTGIEKIKPPLRLSFSPYVSSNYNHISSSGSGDFRVSGGMDIKYGINESYTLDMSLVPDFSQVQSDNKVLNLSAFEVKYNENRQFFTEGMELSNKGNLFYSRRVGGTSGTVNYNTETEEVISQPTAANLLNATKVSGRNKKGFGIGVFNAVTDKTKARVRNIEDGTVKEVAVDPTTNFSVIVLDQNLKNNSNLNFTQTTVVRGDGGNDANVSGVSASVNDRTLRYRTKGFVSFSNVARKGLDGGDDAGYKYTLEAGKVSGTWQYGISRNVESKQYQINDLGYMRSANEVSHYGYTRYNIYKPVGILNKLNSNLSFYHERLFQPRVFTTLDISANTYAQFKNFWAVGVRYGLNPGTSYDYYEPRTEGLYFHQPASHSYNLSVESDSRKPLKANLYSGRWRRPDWDQKSNWMGVFLRYRVSNKLSFNVEVNGEETGNSRGFVTKQPLPENEEIIFGERQITTATNVAGINYTFNNRMGLNVRLRHYWSKVKYDRFFELNSTGDLLPSLYTGVDAEGAVLHDTNFNAVNLDLVYFLQVAPGSYFNFVWKDAIQSLTNEASLNYLSSYQQAMGSAQTNNVSIRFTYFLDYLSLKKLNAKS